MKKEQRFTCKKCNEVKFSELPKSLETETCVSCREKKAKRKLLANE